MNIPFLFLSVFVLFALPIGAPVMAADPCKIDKLEIGGVIVTRPKHLGDPAKTVTKAQLKDIVAFDVTRFEPPTVSAECVRKLTLFIDGRPITDANPIRNKPLTFALSPTEKSGGLWRLLLGRPTIDEVRRIDVGVGLPDGPVLAQANVDLEVLSSFSLYIWLGVFAGLLAFFLCCAVKTSILRDGLPDPRAAPGSKGTYSLARTQAAWWLFVILACYMLIGVATGDFLSSINGTAVVLLGIGGGTALGGAAIDASKDTPKNREEKRAATARTGDRINALGASIESNSQKLRAQPAATSAETETATSAIAQQEKEKVDTQSQHDKLLGVSESFIKDILSDANGVNFHRFQMLAWTLVLSAVFAEQVYENLAMPTLSPVLIGLLGLSAGTYLGLKIPEPVVPKT